MSKPILPRTLGVFTLPLLLSTGCDDLGPAAAAEARNEHMTLTSLKLSSDGGNYLLHPMRVAVAGELTGAAFDTELVVGLWAEDGSVGCTLGAMPVTHAGEGAASYAHEAVFVVPATCHELAGRDDLALFVAFDPWNRIGDREIDVEEVGGYRSEYEMVAGAALGERACDDCTARHALLDSPGMDAQLRELNLSSVVVMLPVDPEGHALEPAADRPDLNVSALSRVVGLPAGKGLERGRVQIGSRIRPRGSSEPGRALIQRKGGESGERAPVKVPGYGDVTTGLALYLDDATRQAIAAGEWAGVQEFELVTCLATDFAQAVYRGETEPRADDCGTLPITVVRQVVDPEGPPVQARTAGKVRSAETWGDSWGANSSYGFGYSGVSFMTWLDVNGSDGPTTTYKGIDVHSAGSWFEAGVDAHATVFNNNVNLIDIYATFIGYDFGGGGVAMGASVFLTDFIPEFEIQLADGVPVSLQEMFDAAGLDIDPTLTQSVTLVGVNFDDGCGSVSAGLWIDATIGIDTEETTITAGTTEEGVEVSGTVTPFFNLAAKAGTSVHYSEYLSGGITATLDLLDLHVPFTVSVEYVDFAPLDAVKLVFSEYAEAVLTTLSGDISFDIKYKIPWPICWANCTKSHSHTIASWDGLSTSIEFFDLSQTVRAGTQQASAYWCTHTGAKLHSGDFDGDGAADYLCHDTADGRLWIDYDGSFGGTDWSRSASWCIGGKLLIGDFNGDGRDDLMCHNYANKVIDYADSNAQFMGADWSYTLSWCVHGGAEIEAGDYDKDGRDDLHCHDSTGKKWLDYADTNGRFGGTDWVGFVMPNGFCGQYDGDTIALKTHHGRYVRAGGPNDSYVVDQSANLSNWERFVVDCDGEEVAFKTWHSRYVQANDEASSWIAKQQTFIGPWETFTPVEQEDGTWAFLTHHNRYLQANDANTSWQVRQQTYVGPWEKFTVVPQ
ncbi:esterase [Nannocystis sp. RBIL2]|uniref:esterase n=1 Tax=Nannocystis sp. RBIL2 TaxID=2996788 RepID=UPI00226F2EB2|nr:esterase [Nannocystis sp. RBIL2]MCY1069806.1 esterase [Nannocystis sp. RBIL2]